MLENRLGLQDERIHCHVTCEREKVGSESENGKKICKQWVCFLYFCSTSWKYFSKINVLFHERKIKMLLLNEVLLI